MPRVILLILPGQVMKQLAQTSLATGKIVRLLAVLGVGLFLALFLYASLTRTRQFSPDSMNYVDVARNIATGRGITQSTLGYNRFSLFTADSTIPEPFTAQAPLYPLLIALVSRAGLTYADAALVIPVVAYAITLLVGFSLTRNLYDEHAALLAVGCLLIYSPLHYVARFAWSEIVGIVLLLLFLWLLVRFRQSDDTSDGRMVSLAAGLAAGLTFTTRYALLPIFILGLFFIALEQRKRKLGFQPLLFYLIGFGLPAGLVSANNIVLSGALFPSTPPSDRNLLVNLSDTFWTIFGDYSPIGTSEVQVAAAGSILIVFVLVLAAQRRLRDLPNIFLRNGRYLLVLWSVGYLIFIVGLRSVSDFSPLDERIIVPASTVLVILFAALGAQVIKPAIRTPAPLYGLLTIAALTLSVGEIGLALTQPVYSFAQIIAGSERLSWISQHTTDRDLIIGDDTMDVPFYLGREAAVSFSPYPHTLPLTYPTLVQFADHNCARYKQMYLVLRSYSDWTYRDQIHLFGRFIADVKFGRAGSYPRVRPVTELSDAFVFQVACRQSIR
jgi:4-amino-4-deoxy-L-arabinose transferase-like glycosyltransferase